MDVGQVDSRNMVPALSAAKSESWPSAHPSAGCPHPSPLTGPTGNVRRRGLKEVSRPLSAAPLRGPPAAPPGHPEQRQPPQPEDAAWRRGPERHRPGRPPQVAAVHPLQDGPGGDPVLRGGLPVLPALSGAPASPRQHSGLAITGFNTTGPDRAGGGPCWYCAPSL